MSRGINSLMMRHNLVYLSWYIPSTVCIQALYIYAL